MECPSLEEPVRPDPARHWIKSSLSFSNGNCVEVANPADEQAGVRHGRDTEDPVLRSTPDEWHAFLGGVRNGEFDSLLLSEYDIGGSGNVALD